MYNKKWKAWEAPSYEESLLIWCREPFNRENPQALYMLADDALSRVERGKGTAEAVWQMEKAADLGLAQAADVPAWLGGSPQRQDGPQMV